MRSTSPAKEWFVPCNVKLTVSEAAEQPSIQLKLLQHALHGRKYYSYFVGSGLTLAILPVNGNGLVVTAYSSTPQLKSKRYLSP